LDLDAIRGGRYRHGDDEWYQPSVDPSGVRSNREIAYLVDTVPPSLKILKISAKGGRHHPVKPKAEQLGITDDAARQPAADLVSRVRLADTEGPVDPHQHEQTV
jgi:hypothetical protein